MGNQFCFQVAENSSHRGFELLGFNYTRSSDFEDAFCRLADFERSADHGFLQYFSVDYEFCLF